MHRHIVAFHGTRVDAHARTRRLAEPQQPSRLGEEAAGRILGVDAALDGVAALRQRRLVPGEWLPGGDRQLRVDEIDAAICLHPEFAVPKSMAWKLLRAEPLVVLAPSHMAHEDPLDLIRREPFVRYDRSLGGGKQADRYLRKRGIAPNERFELSSLLAIALMVLWRRRAPAVAPAAVPLTDAERERLDDLLNPKP